MVILLAFIALAAAIAAAISANADPNTSPYIKESLRRAQKESNGPLTSGMHKLAAPIASTKVLQTTASARTWKSLNEKVIGSGLYGGSMEVFLSYTFAHAILASAAFLSALLFDVDSLVRVALIILGFGLLAYPSNRVRSKLKDREKEVAESLPEFVELLNMTLTTMSIDQALKFSLRHTGIKGPIAAETQWLLDTINARTMSDDEAFRQAGIRVGTPEALAFYSTLGRGYTQGGKVSETLANQAESLRKQSFERRRAEMKKFPVRMTLIFGLHFIPLLIVIALVPLTVGFQNF